MAVSKSEIQILLRAIDKTNNTVNGVARQVKNLSNSQARAARVGQRLQVVQRGIQTQLSGGIGTVSRMATAVLSLAAAYGAVRGAVATLAPSIETEEFETQLAVLLGGFDQAEERIRNLQEFNKATPFELPELVQASKALETLTQGALSSGDGLRMVADVAVATGQPFQELAIHVGRAYDGLNNGRPVGEALMRLQELGVVSGATRSKIEALQKTGAEGKEVWAVLAKEFERFRGLTELGSKTFSGALSNLSDTFRQLRENFSTPIRDTLTPILETVSEKLDELSEDDRTAAAGQAVAAFINAAMTAFEEGRFSEFVGLTMEAGFEQGAIAFRKIVNEDLDWYSQTAPRAIAGALVSGLVIFSGELTKNLLTIPVTLKAVNDAIVQKIGLELKSAGVGLGHQLLRGILEGVSNAMKVVTVPLEKLANTLRIPSLVDNKVFQELDRAAEKLDRLADKSRILQEGNAAPAIGELLTLEFAQAHDQIQAVNGLVDESVEALRKLTKLRGESADEAERDLSASKELAGIIEKNLRLIQEQQAARQAEKESILQQNQTGDSGDNSKSESNVPIPRIKNPVERMSEQMARFQEVTTAAATVLQGTFNGISSSIEGLINGTMRWGDALRNIAGSIVQSIIRSFADMAAAYVVNQLLIRGAMTATKMFGSALRKADAAETVATETAKTPVLAQNATYASIGSFGAAAIIGLALVTAAIAAIAGGFQSGGFTGNKPENKVAGVVHGQEFVAHAAATRRYRNVLEGMNRGERPEVLQTMIGASARVEAMPGTIGAIARPEVLQKMIGVSARPEVVEAMATSGFKRPSTAVASRTRPAVAQASSVQSGQSTPQPSKLSVAIVDDRQSFRNFFDSSEGRRAFVRLSQQNSVELGT